MLTKNFQEKVFAYPVLIITIIMMMSCHHDSLKVNVSDVEVKLQTDRFENDMFSNMSENTIAQKYGSFADIFCFQMIDPMHNVSKDKNGVLKFFREDSVNIFIAGKCKTKFSDFTPYEQQLTEAFKHYKYYFPEKLIPRIVTFISGFNFSVAVTDSVLGIGVDMYLGDTAMYRTLPPDNFPRYRIRKMRSEYLVCDAMRGWTESEFPADENQNDFLGGMIYEGKILYFLQAMMPEIPDSVRTGYSSQQLKWCSENEKNTWSFFIDHNLIYSTNITENMKYLNDGPTTNGFPKESPGGIGKWMGWQIVNAYMSKTKTSLSALLKEQNAKKILNDSKYKPKK